MKPGIKSIQDLQAEVEELRYQLSEAQETINAIRTGQVDALVVESGLGHQLYTLKSADIAYRVFIEKMTEGAVTLNKEGIIVYCNSQFASMVHLPLSKVIGLQFENFIVQSYLPVYKSIFEKCWDEECKGEIELEAKTHTTPVQLSFAALVLEEGISLSIIITDLTAQKKTQQLLEQSNQQLAHMNLALEISNYDLQQFASVASHDLQEPLRKIQMFSNLIKDKGGITNDSDSEKYLDKIIESASRMKKLIIEVLNYSKLSANNNLFECVNLNDIINELLEDFEILIQEKNAEIIIGNLPCVEVNRGQIRQAFQNIIANALKFSKPGVAPHIIITAKSLSEKSFGSAEQKDGPFFLITIEDNGIGFDEKYAPNIFALFERLHSKDTYEGTGIGLTITKKIIEKHNGLITAHSMEGKGSNFMIILPVKQ